VGVIREGSFSARTGTDAPSGGTRRRRVSEIRRLKGSGRIPRRGSRSTASIIRVHLWYINKLIISSL